MADRNISATTNVDTISAALKMASPDKLRYALHALYLGPEGIVASDGKCLFWCKWDNAPEWEGPPALLAPEDAKQILRLAKARKTTTIELAINGKVEAFGQAFAEPHGIYPAWKQVLPSKPAKEPAAVDSAILANALESAHKAWRGGRNAKAIRDAKTFPAGKLQPMKNAWTFQTEDERVYVLVMGTY